MPTASPAHFTQPSGPPMRPSPCLRVSIGTSGSDRSAGGLTTGEAGHALSGCFIGDVNWSPHHYDIIQWTINPDPSAPIEVSYENHGSRTDDAVIHYRYANGVIVHSVGYPGEQVGEDGGANFVGTEGRIAVDRDSIVSYPANILEEPLRPEDTRVYRANSHSGNFLEVRPQPAPDHLQSRDRRLYHERYPHWRDFAHLAARPEMGPRQSRVSR